MTPASSAPEQGPQLSATPEMRVIVHQPPKMRELNDLLLTFEELPSRVSEMTGEDRSGDMGASSAGAGRAAAVTQPPPRERKIMAMPQDEQTLKQELKAHIQREVQTLNQEAKKIERLNRPGAAHRLTKLYARIRRLNGLIAEILQASYETVKRLFIRVFIDEQPVL